MHVILGDVAAKNSVEARLSQHDREIAAIRKLVLTGMKMLVRLEKRCDQLAVSQAKTERMMQAFLRRGANGRQA
jgi:hypothetical protein